MKNRRLTVALLFGLLCVTAASSVLTRSLVTAEGQTETKKTATANQKPKVQKPYKAERNLIVAPSHARVAVDKAFGDIDVNPDKLNIGDGFNSATAEPGARCIIYNDSDAELTTVITTPGQNVEFHLEQVQSLQQLEEMMNVHAAASFGWGIFSGDASFDFFKSGSYSSYSSYLFVDVQVLNATRQLKSKRLRADMKNLASSNLRAFVTRCGDEYIYGYRSGGQFTAIVQFESSSAQERQHTEAAISASINALVASGSGSVAFQNAIASLNQTSRQKVYILRKGDEGSLGNISQVVDTALVFPDKVKMNGGHPWTYALLTQSYQTAINFPNGVDLTYVQNQGRSIAEYSKWLEQAYTIRSDLSYVLSHPDEFVIPDQAALHNAYDHNEEVIRDVLRLGEACRDNPRHACDVPTPPVFPNVALNWQGKPQGTCTVWKKRDANGALYSVTVDAKQFPYSTYQMCTANRPCQYPPQPYPFPSSIYKTGYIPLPVASGVIYAVDHPHTGDGCGWCYDPGDHNPGGAEYQARYDIVENGRAIRWYRMWQRQDCKELYRLYYAVPEIAVGTACNTPEAIKPSHDCRWYPQPESCSN